MHDVFNRLFLSSSPQLAAMDRSKLRTFRAKIIVPSHLDALTEALFASKEGGEDPLFMWAEEYEKWGQQYEHDEDEEDTE